MDKALPVGAGLPANKVSAAAGPFAGKPAPTDSGLFIDWDWDLALIVGALALVRGLARERPVPSTEPLQSHQIAPFAVQQYRHAQPDFGVLCLRPIIRSKRQERAKKQTIIRLWCNSVNGPTPLPDWKLCSQRKHTPR